MALNPQILSNALDRGFARNRQKRLDAELRDDRQFQRQRQMQADQRQNEIYQRNVADYEEKKKNAEMLRKADTLDLGLTLLKEGKPIPQELRTDFDDAFKTFATLGANRHAADDRERQFAGLVPLPDGRYAAELEVKNPDGTTYRAPMTMNGSSDPNDPVKAWTVEDLYSNFKPIVEMMRVRAGDRSPLTARQQAAKLKAQYAREDAQTKAQRDWEMKKLGLKHRFKLDEMGTEYGYKGRLAAAKRKGEAKTKNPWDEKKISDAIRKGMFQMHGLEFGVDPNTPQSLQAIEDSNRATAIALEKFRNGEQFNINQIMADVYGGRVKNNQYAAKRGELEARGIPGASMFWDNDEKMIEAVKQAFPPDAPDAEVAAFLKRKGVDKDSISTVLQARNGAAPARGIGVQGRPARPSGASVKKIQPGDVAAMRRYVAAAKKAIANGADSNAVMQRLRAMGVDFDALRQ